MDREETLPIGLRDQPGIQLTTGREEQVSFLFRPLADDLHLFALDSVEGSHRSQVDHLPCRVDHPSLHRANVVLVREQFPNNLVGDGFFRCLGRGRACTASRQDDEKDGYYR